MGAILNSIISDKTGTLSATRVSFLMCTFISNMAVFLVWVFLSIAHSKMELIPESVIFLYCLANGITFTGKMVQKQIERSCKGEIK